MHDFFTTDHRPGRGARRGPQGADGEGRRGRGRGFGGGFGGGFAPVPPLPPMPFGGEGPFGPGHRGPFGPGGFGPGGFGRRGRARRGDVRTAILQLLSEQPLNGYQVISTLAERTEGAWKPSPGAVYPALSQLEDEGLVEGFDNEGQKAFRLTDAGREAPEVGSETPRTWDEMKKANAGWDRGAATTLWQEFGHLAQAVRAISVSADSAQQEKATKALADTRRALYGLLAADE